MKSSLLPDTFLIETKPWKDNEGMFFCAGESGKKLLREFQNNERIEIIDLIQKIINDDDITQHIREKKIEKTLLKKDNFTQWYMLTINNKKYFLKTIIDPKKDGYGESISLFYIKQKIKYLNEKIKERNIENIVIDVIEPLIGMSNKHTWESLIIYPYIENFKTIKDMLWEFTDNQIKNINTTYSIIQETFINQQREDKFYIWDVWNNDWNLLISKDWEKVKITICDPFITLEKFRYNISVYDNKSFHKIFTQ